MNTPTFEWYRAVRRGDLHPTVQHVIMMLATYADADGRNAFPGEERLARDTGRSVSVVRRALAAARAAGWIVRDETSSARRRARGHADVYMLTIPAERVAEPAAPAAAPVDNPPSSRASTGHQRTSTGRPRPQAPVAHDRSPIQRPTHRPTTRARAAERALVVDVLRRETGKTIDHEHADLVIRQVLDGRSDIRHRLVYLRAALEREPHRYLPTPIPPRYVPEPVAA